MQAVAVRLAIAASEPTCSHLLTLGLIHPLWDILEATKGDWEAQSQEALAFCLGPSYGTKPFGSRAPQAGVSSQVIAPAGGWTQRTHTQNTQPMPQRPVGK